MKENMAKIEYAQSFKEKALVLLRDMVDKKLDTIPYGDEFSNFSVVIGKTDKQVVMVLDGIPEDIKKIIGDKKVYVVTE